MSANYRVGDRVVDVLKVPRRPFETEACRRGVVTGVTETSIVVRFDNGRRVALDPRVLQPEEDAD